MKAKDFTVGTEVVAKAEETYKGIVICNTSRYSDETVIVEWDDDFLPEAVLADSLLDWSEKAPWEKLYENAIAACEKAYTAIDDITGWSGGGGNWPAQDASTKIQAALKALKATNKE